MPYASLADRLRRQRERRAEHGPETRRSERVSYRPADRLRKQRSRKQSWLEMPFCGVDGEGGGTDEKGRQNYLMLRAGEFLLFKDNQPLSTEACLEFLCDLPTDRIYVAYYFDYDVTMILKDTSFQTRERLLQPKIYAAGLRRSTYVGDYDVEYTPHKMFRVKRTKDRKWITINDVGSFFQCSFHKAITDWQVGTPEERVAVKKGKEARSDFELMTAEEIEYNRIEVNHLEQLMTAFRNVCEDCGYLPPRWQGPGYLASEMMKQHGIPKRTELALPNDLLPFANAGYYGGRFELFKIGNVRNVYEYDINSAYPTAMGFLPCLHHGTWIKGYGDPRTDEIYIANVEFENNNVAACDLPIRDKKTGSIYWPYRGNGIYWGWELNAAMQAHTVINQWREHWVYHRECDCVPFKWVKEVYAKRKAIGKGTKGYALKLAINSLYGKTAQSIGSAPYANPIWAGLITAYTRAKLIDAYREIDSRNLVMLATDGLYSTEPVNVPLGEWLGEWEMKQHAEMFFVQPGIYFYGDGSGKAKTRGVKQAVVTKAEPEFREIFARWMQEPLSLLGSPREFPHVTVPLHIFIGMKLANSWGKPDSAGKWVDTTRDISFDFRTKRDFAAREENVIHTFPRQGGRDLFTVPYKRDIGRWARDADNFAAMCADQPDFFAFGPGDERE